MDINRLEEFITLADNLNYSKAARILYLTQPVLSRHIHELEETLGGQLFIRDTHKVSLTPFGEMAAEQIRPALEAYNLAMKNIQSHVDEQNGSIEVGFMGQAVKPFIAQFASRIENKPNLSVEYVSISELDEIITEVENGDIDVAFITHIEEERSKNIQTKMITENPLYVVVPKKSELAGKESISIKELSGVPMVTFNRDKNPHTAIFHEKLFKYYGVELNSVRSVKNADSALFYVDAGIGAFILPEHLLSMVQDLPVVRISDEKAVISLQLIWKKDTTKPAVQTFIKEFTNFYRDFKEE